MSHHAVYVGGGLIVHFTGGAGTDTSLAAKAAARIKKESVSKIADLANSAHAFLEVVPRPQGALERDQVVAKALTRVGDAGYNLLLSNCEHFAHWCVTGESRSVQVMSALQAPARFIQQAADDFVEASRHPVKGKPMRHVVGTIKSGLAVLAAHLLLVSW